MDIDANEKRRIDLGEKFLNGGILTISEFRSIPIPKPETKRLPSTSSSPPPSQNEVTLGEDIPLI